MFLRFRRRDIQPQIGTQVGEGLHMCTKPLSMKPDCVEMIGVGPVFRGRLGGFSKGWYTLNPGAVLTFLSKRHAAEDRTILLRKAEAQTLEKLFEKS